MSTPIHRNPVSSPARTVAATPPTLQPVKSVVSPLLPVLLPLVITSVVLGVLFTRLFPPDNTAGAPLARFTDVTAEAGLQFVHRQGGDAAPTTLGGGVCVFDYNQDGRPDLFFVNGAPWPWEESLEKRLGRNSALYRNDGQGHFTDVTALAGLNGEMQGMAAVAGDFDNDGLPDLYVTCIGRNHLFRNLGQGRFEDVTEPAGVGGEENTWSTGAAWIDVDGDGRLDLVVLHYARWPQEMGLGQAFAVAEMGRSYGTPTGFFSVPPTVYRNLGHGHFAPLPDAAGLRDTDAETGRPVAWPLALTPIDANGDRRLDLLVTYHNHPSSLFVARREGGFAKQALASDTRQEGAAASLVASSSLPLPRGDGGDERFQALRAATGLASAVTDLALVTKLGVAPIDVDLNSRLELFSANGLAETAVNRFETSRDFRSPPQLLWQAGDAWRPVAGKGAAEQPAFPRITGRGIATADFDGDGDDDVIIAQNNGGPLLLRNDQRTGFPWLRLRLIATRSQPEAGGARVEVQTPRRILTQTVAPALGFMAQSESILTFGLGDDARVRKIVIQWPSGQVQELRPEGLNRLLEIREP